MITQNGMIIVKAGIFKVKSKSLFHLRELIFYKPSKHRNFHTTIFISPLFVAEFRSIKGTLEFKKKRQTF